MLKLTLDEAKAVETPQLRDWVYNALDCTGTREIADVLLPRLDDEQRRIYRMEMAMQTPALAMSLRGVRVNMIARDEAIAQLKKDLKRTEREFNKLPLVLERWDGKVKVTGECKSSTRKDSKHTWAKGEADTPARLCTSCGMSRFTRSPINPNSATQIKHFFYDILRMKPMFNKAHEVSVDDEVLGRLKERHPEYSEIIGWVQDVRSYKKQLGFLQARLTRTLRYASSFNVGAAWTGRWSSSKNAYHEGGNLQNISERHRHIFVADPGMELCYADLKQAESNLVAHLAGDEGYIEAHNIGDVHTYVTRLVWPDMDWQWDIKLDKKLAKGTNPDWDDAPGHDLRFQSKRVQHGSNYGLEPYGLARIARIPVKAAKEAQINYFSGFPFIPGWHGDMSGKVKEQETLYNPLGRKLRLFGRPDDKHTFKQGLAFPPQSGVADIINIGLWRLFYELELTGQIELLGQIHDAILFQYPKGRLDIVARALELMTVPVPVTDYRGNTRIAIIETEAATGLNWGHKSPENPHGIDEGPIEAYLKEHKA